MKSNIFQAHRKFGFSNLLSPYPNPKIIIIIIIIIIIMIKKKELLLVFGEIQGEWLNFQAAWYI